MRNLPVHSLESERRLSRWRQDAARLAAELLCVVSPAVADGVLDLRSALLDGRVTAGEVLRVFLTARNQLEQEHYLLFYRLRRVLEPALGVEVSVAHRTEARQAVDFRWLNVAQLTRALQRERFEQDLEVASLEEVEVRIVWRF